MTYLLMQRMHAFAKALLVLFAGGVIIIVAHARHARIAQSWMHQHPGLQAEK
jgi:NADH:ubiquinone oxidoreductase subunit 5 (subunit L)/multisubunit Na+/H+ antiporter MnhA subunit